MVNFQDLGISLKEGRPFILGDGKFSGNPDLDIWKCWRHLENRDAQISRRSEKSGIRKIWRRTISGRSILRFWEMSKSPRFLSTMVFTTLR